MTHSTPDPLRETDVPHMHPMEVMARNFRAKLRAALAATPQPAPDREALVEVIAQIIDRPSVYMGGPSRNSLRIADAIVKECGNALLARGMRLL